MPRPLRIEFENAHYHVMNRGAGRKDIFKNNNQRQFFIYLLAEATKLFGIEINAYCLMNNHYHLLVKTPYANLSRAMRHINGLYTQYFNRESKTDGALFRGRYKAILVSYDEYFLNLSRYIHLNPLVAKITTDALRFQWSSYQYFTNTCKRPDWLYIESTLALFSSVNPFEEYHQFINSGVDFETHLFFNKNHTPTIFSSNNFKKNILNLIENKKRHDSSADYNRTNCKYTKNQIIHACSKVFNIPVNKVLNKKNGKANIERKIAIYACRIWSGEKIACIAEQFSCKSCTNISDIVREIKIRINNEESFKNLIEAIYVELQKFPKTST